MFLSVTWRKTSALQWHWLQVDGNQLLHFHEHPHINTGLGKEQGDCADACDFFDSYSDSIGIASWLEDSSS